MNSRLKTILQGVALVLAIGLFYQAQNGSFSALSKKTNLAAISGAGSGLISRYQFEGNANDSVGANHGTVTGAVTYAAGKLGDAASFNGIDTSISIGDVSAIEGVNAFSVSVWVKSNESQNVSGGDSIIKKEGSGSDTFYLTWSQSEDVQFCVVSSAGTSCPGTGTGTGSFTRGIPIGSGTSWHHVVGAYDGNAGQIKVYVDGVLGDVVSTAISGPTKNSVHPIVIGSGWNGLIDDLRLYDQALSQDDVASLYAEGGGSVPAPQENPPTPTSPATTTSTTTPSTPPATPTPDSPVQSIRSNAPSPVQWAAPIGIPDPVSSFGGFDPIRGDHFMYQLQAGQTCSTNPEKCFDYGSGLEPYRDGGNGPYTHYVYPGSSACTNTNNAYGTHTTPRCSLPTVGSLLPGSVVEIHGTITGVSRLELTAQGTAQKPIFIRGASENDRGGFSGTLMRVRGGYTVYENLALNGASLDIRPATTSDPAVHHIVARHNDVYGTNAGFSGSGLAGDPITNIVYFDNVLHPSITVTYQDDGTTGIFNPNSTREFNENDKHNIGVGSNSQNVWILDNDLSLGTGDAVGNAHGANYTAKNFYIGRNLLHDTGENGVDLKEIENVVISQNKIYNFKGGSAGSSGGAVVVHYGPTYSPKNTWFLFNEIYDAKDTGIQIGGDQEYPVYLIGNIIRDITNANGTGVGLSSWNSRDIYALNNIIYNVDRGVDITSNGAVATIYFNNNIVGNILNPSKHHIYLENSAARAQANMKNNLFYQSNGTARFQWGTTMDLPGLKVTTCQGCVEADPKFVNPAGDDYRLQAGSPAIDAANSDILNILATTFQSSFGLDIRKDFLGNTRPSGGAWDIGPFEYGASGGDVFVPPPAFPAAPQASVPSVSHAGVGGSGGSGGSGASVSAASSVIGALSANTAAAQRADTNIPGCSAGANFSIVTGVPCSTRNSDSGDTGSSVSSAYAFSRNLTFGSRGEDVRQLQLFLNSNGFRVAAAGAGSAGNESTYFGPATKAALARYQASKGLAADGVFGPRTMASLGGSLPVTQAAPSISANIIPVSNDASFTNYRVGASGPGVKALRQKLRSFGYLAPYGSGTGVPASAQAETDVYGQTTEAAVKRFQCDKGIACSGTAATTGWGSVGARTRAALGF